MTDPPRVMWRINLAIGSDFVLAAFALVGPAAQGLHPVAIAIIGLGGLCALFAGIMRIKARQRAKESNPARWS